MKLSEIEEIHRRHWRKGYGAVSPREALFLGLEIARARPTRLLELGSASGLSGGLLCRFLAANGGERFESWDLAERFWADPSRPTGFLIGEIAAGLPLEVEVRRGVTSLDLHASGRRFEMAFVDANHRHPWPLLDTLALHEALEGPRVVLHHDLRLHRKEALPAGLGPKFLFDQIPERFRRRGGKGAANVFAIDLAMGTPALAEIAETALHLPWTLGRPFDDPTRDRCRALLGRAFGPRLVAAFDRALRRFEASRPPERGGLRAAVARLLGG